MNDYFVFTRVVSGRDELAGRDTNFRYQAILPLADFQVLCAAGYDIKLIINTLFTQQLLNNKGRDYQPQLAKQITADDLEQIALFDYQAGLAQLEAQFQDQDLLENSLTALIDDQKCQLHFASSPNGEALVYALWHLLPLPTRMQIGVSTGLPDENDAMYKTCVAKNVTTIALQFVTTQVTKKSRFRRYSENGFLSDLFNQIYSVGINGFPAKASRIMEKIFTAFFRAVEI